MKSKWLPLVSAIILVLSGCAQADNSRGDIGIGSVLETIGEIKGMEAYADELTTMDYTDSADVTVDSVRDSTTLYNNLVWGYKISAASDEWHEGALSLFISCIPGVVNRTGIQEGEQPYLLVDNEFLELGEYTLYAFTRSETTAGCQQEKIIILIVEKGTESDDTPHVYIYRYERTTGIGRTSIMSPVSDRMHWDVTELGARTPVVSDAEGYSTPFADQ
jgi:hypothetical protein